jgi:hypothetical protein
MHFIDKLHVPNQNCTQDYLAKLCIKKMIGLKNRCILAIKMQGLEFDPSM